VARRLNGSFFAGLAALMITALTHVFPGAQQVVDEHATTEGKALLDALHAMTTAQAVWRFRHVDIGSYVDMSADELWDLPEVRHIFEETKLGRSMPDVPVLVVQAVHDGIISVDDIDALVRTYDDGGSAVTYHRDQFCGHLLLHPLSSPMTLRWLRDRFTDRPLDEHRTRTKWPTLFNPSTHLGMLKLAAITTKVVLGQAVGRRPLSKADAA
jgi:triacylglycerol lipase